MQQAIEYHQQRLLIARELGDRHGESTALIELGYVYRELGNAEAELQIYQQWLPITRETGNRHGEYLALSNLGDAYAALGEARRAIACYQHALELAHGLEQYREAAFILDSLGRAHQQNQHVEESIAWYERSTAMFRDIGDAAGEDWTRWHLALAYEAAGDASRATALMRECVAFATARGLASALERATHLAQV